MDDARKKAVETIVEHSGARYGEVDLPVAIRAALTNTRGGAMALTNHHEEVLTAIGTLTGYPFGTRVNIAEYEPDGGMLLVAERALREIAEVKGQQGSEAKRMAQSALLAMGLLTQEDLER